MISLTFPWYRETIDYENIGPNNETTTGTVYYQLFYFYTIPTCDKNTSCVIQYEDEFIAAVPNTRGLSFWSIEDSTKEEVPSTRVLFLICWIFQFFVLLTVPFTFIRGPKSSVICTIALVSCGGSVIIFFFLPGALQRDYGSSCTNSDGTILLQNETPCSTLYHKETIENGSNTVFMKWSPSFGFLFALINIFVLSILFCVQMCVHPCICTSPPPQNDSWVFDDVFSEASISFSTIHQSDITNSFFSDSSKANDEKALL